MDQINDIPMPDADINITPVILLVDVSSSMKEHVNDPGEDNGMEKIAVVNKYMHRFFEELARTCDYNNELDVCIIAFGTNAEVILNLSAVDQVPWPDLSANGQTNLTEALQKSKAIVENRGIMPKNCGRPSLLLISDGHPYPPNNWQRVLEDYVTNGRTAICDRFAMGIGSETDYNMLSKFASKPEYVFRASNALDIGEFFRYVSTHTRAKTRTGNSPGGPRGAAPTNAKPFVTVVQPGAAPKKKNPFMN